MQIFILYKCIPTYRQKISGKYLNTLILQQCKLSVNETSVNISIKIFSKWISFNSLFLAESEFKIQMLVRNSLKICACVCRCQNKFDLNTTWYVFVFWSSGNLFQTRVYLFSLSDIGPTQVKCWLLISSIFDAMNS